MVIEIIRVGTRVINLAAIESIDLDYDMYGGRRGVLIRFISPGGEQGRDMFFEGDEGQAVRHYFERQSRDLMSGHARQHGSETNKAAGEGG